MRRREDAALVLLEAGWSLEDVQRVLNPAPRPLIMEPPESESIPVIPWKPQPQLDFPVPAIPAPTSWPTPANWPPPPNWPPPSIPGVPDNTWRPGDNYSITVGSSIVVDGQQLDEVDLMKMPQDQFQAYLWEHEK